MDWVDFVHKRYPNVSKLLSKFLIIENQSNYTEDQIINFLQKNNIQIINLQDCFEIAKGIGKLEKELERESDKVKLQKFY